MTKERYIVECDDQTVGVWKTQKEAQAHVNRMLEYSNYKEIGWRLETN